MKLTTLLTSLMILSPTAYAQLETGQGESPSTLATGAGLGSVAAGVGTIIHNRESKEERIRSRHTHNELDAGKKPLRLGVRDHMRLHSQVRTGDQVTIRYQLSPEESRARLVGQINNQIRDNNRLILSLQNEQQLEIVPSAEMPGHQQRLSQLTTQNRLLREELERVYLLSDDQLPRMNGTHRMTIGDGPDRTRFLAFLQERTMAGSRVSHVSRLTAQGARQIARRGTNGMIGFALVAAGALTLTQQYGSEEAHEYIKDNEGVIEEYESSY